jgi:hypothetical protein
MYIVLQVNLWYCSCSHSWNNHVVILPQMVMFFQNICFLHPCCVNPSVCVLSLCNEFDFGEFYNLEKYLHEKKLGKPFSFIIKT